LVVIAVIASLVSLAVPSIGSIFGGAKVNQTITELGGLLEQARQYAVAQNTHVWVLFNTDTVGSIDTLSIAVVASKDGTDPGSYGTVPSDNFTLISKMRTFPQFQLKNAGYFTSDKIPLLPLSPPVSDSANNLSASKSFSIKPPGNAGSVTFDRSLEFTPGGEARNASNPIDIIEFGLQPAKTSSTPDANNVVVMRVNGLTGQTLVYRP
jgi:type II secretory pathway pseudopilin PulG